MFSFNLYKHFDLTLEVEVTMICFVQWTYSVNSKTIAMINFIIDSKSIDSLQLTSHNF